MAMSDCPKCYDTPCSCGHEYTKWNDTGVTNLYKVMRAEMERRGLPLTTDDEQRRFGGMAHAVRKIGAVRQVVVMGVERIAPTHKDFERYRTVAIDTVRAWQDGFTTLRVEPSRALVGAVCVELIDNHPTPSSVHVQLFKHQPEGPVVGTWEVIAIVRETYGSV